MHISAWHRCTSVWLFVWVGAWCQISNMFPPHLIFGTVLSLAGSGPQRPFCLLHTTMPGSYLDFWPWTLAHVLVWHRWPYWAIFPTLRAKWFKPGFPPFLFLLHTKVQLRRTRLTDSYIFLTLVPIVASQVDFNCSVYKMRTLIGLRNCFKETATERCSQPYGQYL